MDTQMTLAVMADIHGNALALEAVLADARSRGISQFVNLGDTFYGPLDPAGTWRILRDMDIPTILGNQDRILLEAGPEWTTVPAFKAAVSGIGREGLEWLRTLPGTAIIDDIFFCHGTPTDDMAYLLEDISTGKPTARDCKAVEADILPAATGCTLVLTGHSHSPGTLHCTTHTIVNPGSVGLPAYTDDMPPHAMTSGSPHARYALITRHGTHWNVEHLAVEYDWKAAAFMARENGREDWATWLSTGIA